MTKFIYLITILIGYACGCFLTAVFVVRKYKGCDVSQVGTGNPGMANVMAQVGKVPGLMVLAGDIAKTALAMGLCWLLFGGEIGRDAMLYSGLGVLLGHNFPIQRGFRGGKGVTVTCTWIILLLPASGIVSAVAGGLITVLTGLLPLGAVLITLFIVPFAWAELGNGAAVVMVISLVIMLYRHFPGLVRGFKNQEKREFHKRRSLRAIIGCIIIIILVAYLAFIDILISLALVPDFMEQFDSFEEITEESVAELVHTSDIEDNGQAQRQLLLDWMDTLTEETYVKVSLQSQDGYQLVAAEFLQPEHTDKWALLVHGYTGSKEEMYTYARWYYEQGYNCLVPDLRCQGQSQGDYIGLSLTDCDDCLDWLDAIIAQNPDARIVLHGQSMGAATVLMMTGRELPNNVVACISDCAYTTAYDMAGDKFVNWFGLPKFPIVDSMCIYFRLRGGYDVYAAAPIEAVGKSSTPTLFIHGTDDAMVGYYMGQQLYDAAACPKEFYTVEGAGHSQAKNKDPEAYYAEIEKFLKEYGI